MPISENPSSSSGPAKVDLSNGSSLDAFADDKNGSIRPSIISLKWDVLIFLLKSDYFLHLPQCSVHLHFRCVLFLQIRKWSSIFATIGTSRRSILLCLESSNVPSSLWIFRRNVPLVGSLGNDEGKMGVRWHWDTPSYCNITALLISGWKVQRRDFRVMVSRWSVFSDRLLWRHGAYLG